MFIKVGSGTVEPGRIYVGQWEHIIFQNPVVQGPEVCVLSVILKNGD
jgi:hypothetical protein